MGFSSLGLLANCTTAQPKSNTALQEPTPEDIANLYPAKRNPEYRLDRRITEEQVAGSYNNFYEFTTDKESMRLLVDRFVTLPWQLEVRGLVQNPKI